MRVESVISRRDAILWQVEPLFDPHEQERAFDLHRALLQDTLARILPLQARTNATLLASLLPLVRWSRYYDPPFNLTFSLLSAYTPTVFRFFYEMVSRWLVPGTHLEVGRVGSTNFRIPSLGNTVYALSEVVVRVRSSEDFSLLKRHLPCVEAEIRLGAASSMHARRLLESRGVSNNEKTAMIQENIAWVLQRRGHLFGEDILREMQHFLVQSHADFLASHSSRHISRLICIHSYFRRQMVDRITQRPHQRHLMMKVVNGERRVSDRAEPVLGIFVAVNILRGTEVFEARQLLGAVAHHIPGLCACPGTYLPHPPRDDGVQTLYLEVVKRDLARFTAGEIQTLRQVLPGDLKSRIGHQMHSVFMPQNDEEIMRYILTLSDQLKLVRDLPQVVILFREQTDVDIVFTVILLRVLCTSDSSLAECLSAHCPGARVSKDLTKVVGHIRKKRHKEANVFRLFLRKDVYLRGDSSLDLFQARQTVVETVRRAIGEFRDYNGGMIAKQKELLTQVRSMLGAVAERHDWLLENLFHSMRPVVMRSVLEPSPVAQLFRMLVDALGVGEDERSEVYVDVQEDALSLYVLMAATDAAYRDRVVSALATIAIPTTRLISAHLQVADAYVLGLIYQSEEQSRREELLDALESTLESVPGRSQPRQPID